MGNTQTLDHMKNSMSKTSAVWSKATLHLPYWLKLSEEEKYVLDITGNRSPSAIQTEVPTGIRQYKLNQQLSAKALTGTSSTPRRNASGMTAIKQSCVMTAGKPKCDALKALALTRYEEINTHCRIPSHRNCFWSKQVFCTPGNMTLRSSGEQEKYNTILRNIVLLARWASHCWGSTVLLSEQVGWSDHGQSAP